MNNPKHVPHIELSIAPVADLKNNSWVAYLGAKYHLFKINQLTSNLPIQALCNEDETIDLVKDKEYFALKNQVYWHLRSFFWELIATYDTILQWVNSKFQLGLNESKVNLTNLMKNVSNAKKDVNTCKAVLSKLEAANESEWFLRSGIIVISHIVLFYIFNRKSQTIMVKVPPRVLRTWLNLARVGQTGHVDLVTQLNTYLTHFDDLLQDIFN